VSRFLIALNQANDDHEVEMMIAVPIDSITRRDDELVLGSLPNPMIALSKERARVLSLTRYRVAHLQQQEAVADSDETYSSIDGIGGGYSTYVGEYDAALLVYVVDLAIVRQDRFAILQNVSKGGLVTLR